MREISQGRLLHIRSLNHLIRDHKFTYVGARLLADSLHPDVIEKWTSEYISRKSQTNRRQVYWKYSLFKGFNREQEPEYRKCVIGSPTTQLTEVWLLWRLSQEEAFKQHPSVYSYFWPHEKSTHIYKYFFEGYMQREHRISEACSEMEDAHVVVEDLRAFYPTINVPKLRERFSRRIERTTLNPSERRTAIQCVEELTSIKNESGLPIGPQLSHMLANVFFEDLDNKLREKFPRGYFRYVDDVAFVVPSSEVHSTSRYYDDLVRDEGLEVNRGKGDILTGQEWSERVRARSSPQGDSFGQLVSNLRQYLAHNQGDYDSVRDMFRNNGFSLPFSRLRSTASAKGFRQYLKGLWSHYGNGFGRSIPRPKTLLARAVRLREANRERLNKVSNQPLPSSGMSRRWAIQDLRYSLNRALYLQSAVERNKLLALVPECPELRPSRAVINALVTGNASELISYPGPTVSAFCELWKESNDLRPQFSWSDNPEREHRDSASELALSNLCSPPESWTSQLHEESSKVMVNLSSRQRPGKRTFNDFSYIDEIESLFLRPHVNIERLLSTRFDDGEDVLLPALRLGGVDYLS